MNETCEKYKGKILGQAGYKNGSQYTMEELSDIDELYLIMWEIWNHESYLTKDGFSFLEECYGTEKLAELLAKRGGFDEAKDSLSVLGWLRGLKMETLN